MSNFGSREINDVSSIIDKKYFIHGVYVGFFFPSCIRQFLFIFLIRVTCPPPGVHGGEDVAWVTCQHLKLDPPSSHLLSVSEVNCDSFGKPLLALDVNEKLPTTTFFNNI